MQKASSSVCIIIPPACYLRFPRVVRSKGNYGGRAGKRKEGGGGEGRNTRVLAYALCRVKSEIGAQLQIYFSLHEISLAERTGSENEIGERRGQKIVRAHFIIRNSAYHRVCGNCAAGLPGRNFSQNAC